jgi:hypothetical protein
VVNVLAILRIVKIIGGILFVIFAMLLLNIQFILSSTIVPNNIGPREAEEKPELAEYFNIGSGIFALVLFALSLTAYRNLKSTRLLFVSAAFAMFAIHAIVSRLDLFTHIESSVVELFASIIIFLSLALFFIALVRRPKYSDKNNNNNFIIKLCYRCYNISLVRPY